MKATTFFSKFLLLTFLVLSAPALLAQKIVDSGASTAGFRYSTDEAVSTPLIHYQQNIQMLSGIDDRPTLKVYGSGRVEVHYPVYMKKAGDYEMQLDDAELTALILSLSSDGVMDFDKKKVMEKVKESKKASKKKGQFFAISDSVENVVDIKVDEYQKNKTSVKITGFHKQFRWKNIEQDAVRYKGISDIARANQSITNLKSLMKDARLVKKSQ